MKVTQLVTQVSAKSTNVSTYKMDILCLLLFGVILTSLDIYILDVLTVRKFLKEEHYKFAVMFALPMLVHSILIGIFWWKNEEESTKKWTWILVVLQCYPQYRYLKLVYKIVMKSDHTIPWNQEKLFLEKTLSTIEPYYETIPQLLVLACYINDNLENIAFFRGWSLEYPFFDFDKMDLMDHGFTIMFKFNFSVFTGVLGLMKYLHIGVFRVLPSGESKRLGGRLTLGYFLLFISVVIVFVWKGTVLVALMVVMPGQGTWAFFKWLGLCVAPQFITTTAILAWSLKSRFFSVVTSHFPLLLCPVWTCFSFGPTNWKSSSTTRGTARNENANPPRELAAMATLATPGIAGNKDATPQGGAMGTLPTPGIAGNEEATPRGERGAMGTPHTPGVAVSPLVTTINVIITFAVNIYIERQVFPSYEQIQMIFGICVSICPVHLDSDDIFFLYYNFGYQMYFCLFVGGFCTLILVISNKLPFKWCQEMTEFGGLGLINVEKHYIVGKKGHLEEVEEKNIYWLRWLDTFNPLYFIPNL